MTTPPHPKADRRLLIPGLALLGMYVAGHCFPEYFWSTHYSAFLGPVGVLLLLLALALGVSGLHPRFPALSDPLPDRSAVRWAVYGGVAILVATILLLFPIDPVIYGDAKYIVPQVDLTVKKFSPRLLQEVVHMDVFNPKVGTRTFYGGVSFLTWLTGVNGLKLLPWLQAISAMLWVLIWMKGVELLVNKAWRPVLWTVGLTVPFLVLFAGHFELYSFVYPFFLLYGVLLGVFFRKGGRWLLVVAAVVFVLCIRLHITGWILFPSLVLATAWHFREQVAWFAGLFRGRVFLFGMFLPALLAAVMAYTVVKPSVNAPRMFSSENPSETLFLPISAPEPAPMDRYNLLSPAHGWDFAVNMLNWSSAAFFLLLALGWVGRKQLNRSDPALLVMGLTLALFLMAFFLMNPLLSMPWDWDLFALTAPVFLACALLLPGAHTGPRPGPLLVSMCLALALLGVSNGLVHASKEATGERLEILGKYIFKTYWLGSSTTFVDAWRAFDDSALVEARRTKVIEELKPWAVAPNDIEYAELLRRSGQYHRKHRKDNPTAVKYFQQAAEYCPGLAENQLNLVVSAFEAGNVALAHRHVAALVDLDYPSTERALQMGIHISIEATDRKTAIDYCGRVLERSSGDTFIRDLKADLEAGEDLAKLRLRFRQN